MRKITALLLSLFLIGCEPDEIAVTQHPAGNITTRQIDIGSTYNQQIYYKLKEDFEVSENQKTEWDIAFDSREEGWNIIINSSTFSQISELENNSFYDSIIINNLDWKWDNPKGLNNGTAIGDYRNKNTLYILDRGYNLDGTLRGYKKIMIDSINSNSYFIKYANLDNTDINNMEIIKDDKSNLQHLSFDNNEIINIEPKKEEWDLLFTQYTHLFIGNTETPAYLVTGVLTNYLSNIMVAKDTINNFSNIKLNMIEQYVFANNQNEIGYNWKSYDFESQIYNVNSDINYIISDVSGRYFKFRFTGFYNSNGEKGCPNFEIQEL